MATLLIRWLITWCACAFVVARVAGDSMDNKPLYTETKEFLKKRIMEEEILVKFLNQLSKISRNLQPPNNRKMSSAFPDTAAKRIGSEFLGKRLITNTALDATDEDATEAVTKAEILANQLLNFDTSTSNKRLGSEFLGKRRFIGSEFVGKRSFNDHIIATTAGQTSDHVTNDDREDN
ncbi:hypothetical protein CHUAL_004904 [Chamberlinius hualienensis]